MYRRACTNGLVVRQPVCAWQLQEQWPCVGLWPGQLLERLRCVDGAKDVDFAFVGSY